MTSADLTLQPDFGSRLLLRVLGLRSQGTAYRSDDDAELFWLALEGDTPNEVLWMKLEWRYLGASFVYGMKTEIVTLAYGVTPTLASNQFHYSPVHWQSLGGMVLQAVRPYAMYDPPHTAAIGLQFSPWVQPANISGNAATASLLFDAPDLDVPLSMLISDDAHLGHWALRSDVQWHFLTKDPRPWDASWNTPPAPWNDRAHFLALTHFRKVLQDFALWWQTQTAWAIPARSRQAPAPGMWKAVGDLCALQIVLEHQLIFQTSRGDWLDRYGTEYVSVWSKFDGAAAYTDLAQRLGSSVTDWLRWMALEKWHALLGPESGVVYAAIQAGWQEVVRAHTTWSRQFEKLLD